MKIAWRRLTGVDQFRRSAAGGISRVQLSAGTAKLSDPARMLDRRDRTALAQFERAS